MRSLSKPSAVGRKMTDQHITSHAVAHHSLCTVHAYNFSRLASLGGELS